MNIINEHDFQLHITILGWLYLLANAIFLLLAVFAFAFLPAIGMFSGDSDATAILSLVGTGIGLLMVTLGLPGLIAGYGLLKHKPWSRVLALVLGILGLVNFPVGTVLGVYTLFVLFQEPATEYFGSQWPFEKAVK